MQVMQRLQAYKFELRPKPGQAAAFRRTAGCCRFVYNRALAEQQARYERGESHLGYTASCRALAESKQADETAFPAEPHSQPLQQSLKDLGRAYTTRNRKKQKRRIAVLHRHIADARKDYLHKVSTDIGKNHAMVAVEDLKVSNMSASAKGTAEQPGRNVRAKAGLNKAILDQGWFSFRRMLDYKLAWNGGWLIAVDPRNTSRECPACHHVDAANRTAQARFRCTACGFAEHADLVGAVNILSRGMQKLRDEGQDTNDASFGCASTARIACSRPQGPESQA